MKMSLPIDCVLDAKAQIGEGAIWCSQQQVLYWVDISAGVLHCFDPANNTNKSWDMGEALGCFALTGRASLVLALTSGFYEFFPDTEHKLLLSGPNVSSINQRFNDGSVDLKGRFYAGTMRTNGDHVNDPSGTMYSLSSELEVNAVMSGFHIINGMAFSPNGDTAYVSDSFAAVQTIWAYDYDLDDGVWSNKRVFLDTKELDGRPDGAAIDADGCYWMAGISGWELVRITPEGKVDMKIEFPVEKPTRIAFGGSDMDILYVTSLGEDITEGTHQPNAGGLFALKVPGVTGIELPRMNFSAS
ncbi:SMP-30/gluconolactonase/LRE family protein [uncultured Cocleimonas sp.]|uniref:SMP-30/gluconolactonase/LRE family protein n=1 Tax=uncultured Cocleimonas sp. TaxID=1051587 RepID=UPI00261ED879|nr:SMP-30/gluconolactonase/LRE family protein [uncultured Cocleimonas sp.]